MRDERLFDVVITWKKVWNKCAAVLEIAGISSLVRWQLGGRL